MRTTTVTGLILLLAAPALAETTAPLKIQARLLELPRTERCSDNEVRVAVLYRVERVLEGNYSERELVVVHRCPEVPRGPSRIGRGTAGRMRPGHRHLLTLRPLRSTKRVQDRFSEIKTVRYEPTRTNPGPEDPRISVVVSGGAGTRHSVNFDAEAVTVGRAADADVYLADPSVARQQLRLVRTGEQITVHNLDAGHVVLLNGIPITQPTKITYKDQITIGLYTVRAALFLTVKDPG